MSSQRQIEANRRNAQKSTGPTSVTGKAASSMNALKTGIHAKSIVLPCENLAELQQLIDQCDHHYQPSTPEARFFVDDLIRCEWTLRRLDNSEAQMYQYQNNDEFRDPEEYPLGKSATDYSNSFSKLQYRLDATRRARDRALQALARLQAKADAAPAPAPVVEPLDLQSVNPSSQTTSLQIGFVPSTPSTAQPQPAPGSPSPGPHPPEPVGMGKLPAVRLASPSAVPPCACQAPPTNDNGVDQA